MSRRLIDGDGAIAPPASPTSPVMLRLEELLADATTDATWQRSNRIRDYKDSSTQTDYFLNAHNPLPTTLKLSEMIGERVPESESLKDMCDENSLQAALALLLLAVVRD